MRLRPFAPADLRHTLRPWADGAAMALAASLPWSTSATSILLGVWAVLALLSVPPETLMAEVRRPRSWIGVVLVGALLVSVAWSIGGAKEIGQALGAGSKLLALPLLAAQFAGRERAGLRTLYVFGVSVTLLLAVSWITALVPNGPWPSPRLPGVPTKDYISQNVFFVLLAFGALALGWRAADAKRWPVAAAYGVLAALAVANIVTVYAARTTLVFLPVLLVIFVAVRLQSWKALALAATAALVLAGSAWFGSPHVRDRLTAAVTEVERYSAERAETSSGYRLEWYRRSLALIGQNPVLGVGAGGIRAAQQAEARRLGLDERFVTDNPHNQVLWTGVQIGLSGVCLALAMWWAHMAAMGRGSALAAFGSVVVGQSLLFSLLNSHIADFTTGWTYIVVAGVLFALADGERDARAGPV